MGVQRTEEDMSYSALPRYTQFQRQNLSLSLELVSVVLLTWSSPTHLPSYRITDVECGTLDLI